MNQTDAFIKGSGNPIELTLKEEGVAISNVPTELVIEIGSVVTITRTPDGDGVTFAAGVLTIVPAELTEDVSGLLDGNLYPVRIKFSDAQNTDIVYGGNDGTGRIYFLVSTAP